MILEFDVIGHCNNLNQHYGAFLALKGVSLELQAGCTGLLGNNGAGKSTLLKTLLGQLPVQKAKVELLGMDPAVEPLKVRQRVGYMPEREVYFPDMTAVEQVAFCGQLSGMSRSDALSRAHESLDAVSLGEARYRAVDGYSTGMRQRVKLAACLVHGPGLLLLDEPTSGLDPEGREMMLGLIRDLAQDRGLSIVLSTHILQDVERTCDWLVVLAEGQVLYSGARKQFQAASGSRLQVKVKTGTRTMADLLRDAGCKVDVRPGDPVLDVELEPGVERDIVWTVAKRAGLQVRRLTSSEGSLDAAYARIMQEHGDGA